MGATIYGRDGTSWMPDLGRLVRAAAERQRDAFRPPDYPADREWPPPGYELTPSGGLRPAEAGEYTPMGVVYGASVPSLTDVRANLGEGIYTGETAPQSLDDPWRQPISFGGSGLSHEAALAQRAENYAIRAWWDRDQGASLGVQQITNPPMYSEARQEQASVNALEGLLGDLERLANLRNTQLEDAESQASASYGGAIASVNKQIDDAKERMARDTGIINSLIEGAEEIYQGVVQNAKVAGKAAAAAIEANTEAGEKALNREHRGVEGKVRAIMDMVGAEGNKAVFDELTDELDESMRFIQEGFAVSAEGQEALVETAQRMAVTAARATEATMKSEHGRNLDTTITKYNQILENLFKRRASLYAARARAIEQARKEVYQTFGAGAPSDPDEFAQAALSWYIENGEVARQDQQLVMDTMWSLSQSGLSLHTWMQSTAATMNVNSPGTGDAFLAEISATLQPYYDVIQAGASIVEDAYQNWEDTVASPYDTDMSWWERNVIISDIANKGYASDAERLNLINNPNIDPLKLVGALPTIPTSSTDPRYLAALGLGA